MLFSIKFWIFFILSIFTVMKLKVILLKAPILMIVNTMVFKMLIQMLNVTVNFTGAMGTVLMFVKLAARTAPRERHQVGRWKIIKNLEQVWSNKILYIGYKNLQTNPNLQTWRTTLDHPRVRTKATLLTPCRYIDLTWLKNVYIILNVILSLFRIQVSNGFLY